MSTYSLSLDSRGLGDSVVKFSNTSAATITYLGRSISVSLYGVSFCRQMYKPGHIEAEVLMSSTTTKSKAIDIDLLQDMLIHRPVQLYVDTTVVASKYFIHEISPQFTVKEQEVEENGQKVAGFSYTIYIKLDIYSLDFILSQNPVGKAYLGESLCGGIVTETLPSYSLSFTYPKSASENETSQEKVELGLHHRLTNLVYPNDNKKLEEFLQPYLVQYNESFYDFIKRVANRCGEALYFEDGCLQMGLPTKDDDSDFKAAYTISNVSRVIYHRISDGPLKVKDYYRDSSKDYKSDGSQPSKPSEFNSEQTDRGKDGYPTDSFSEEGSNVLSSELASQEQYILLYKDKFKRDFGEKPREYWWNQPAEKGVAWLGALLNCTSLLDLLTKLALDLTRSGVKYKTMTDAANKKGNSLIDEFALKGNNDYATLFTQVDSSLSHWLTVKHYSDIRGSQEAQMRKMICVDMGTGFSAAKLGDFVHVSGDSATYVVVKIEMASSVAWQKTYQRFEGDSANPSAVNYQFIYAIPLSGTTFYPPLLPGPLFRQSGSQLAFVTDNDDPTGQGRVRVRFAWQGRVTSKSPDKTIKELKKEMDDAKDKMDTAKKDLEALSSGTVSYSKETKADGSEEIVVSATKKDDADKTEFDNAKTAYKNAISTYLTAYDTWKHDRDKYLKDSTPWVRMVTPMATEGCGGMFFRPEVGDEVMVNFEQGNVDHPYVEGTLFSKNATIPYPGTRVIASRNGHTVRFLDPDDATLLMAGAYPGFKFLKTFGLSFLQDMTIESGEGVRKALGGIELTDQYGFYRVAMSSHDRQVSVSSPFGDVRIDAFTGITLKAPNGNIKIEGKNIDIKAGNRLNLTSGVNIKEGGFFNTNLAGALIDNVIGGFFDLSLLRDILEVFVRPIDGTLEVKSNRYLLLEAGQGKARPQDADSYRKPDTWSDAGNGTTVYDQQMAFRDLLCLPDKIVDKVAKEFTEIYEHVRTSYLNIKGRYYAAPAAPNVITTPNSVDILFQYMYHIDFGDYSRENVENAYIRSFSGPNRVIMADGTTQEMIDEAALVLLTATQHVAAMKRFIDRYGNDLDEVHSDFIDRLNLDTFYEQASGILYLKNPYSESPAIPGKQANAVGQDPMAVLSEGMYGSYLKKAEDYLKLRNNNSNPFIYNRIKPDTFDSWKKAVKRRLVAFALEKCRESSADNPFDGFAVEDPPRFSFSGPKNALYPYDDADWAKYVAGIKIKPRLSFGEYIKTSGLVTGVVALVKNMIPWESRVWSSTAQGKILLSETSSESMAFKRDSGQLEIYRTPLTKSERNDKELNAKMLNEVKVRLFNIYK